MLAIAASTIFVACKKEEKPVQSTQKKTALSTSRTIAPNYIIGYTNNTTIKMYTIAENGANNVYELDFLNNQGVVSETITATSIFNSVTGAYTQTYMQGETILETKTFYMISYPGDSRKLGGRRSGEGYSDCFQRNWDNFCCDAVGCLAQASSPHLVALAIGGSCLFSASVGSGAGLNEIQYITNFSTGAAIYTNP